MTIEDAVGPILAAAFLLGMLAEIFIPRETQPRLKLWRLIGIGFFVVSGLIVGALLLVLSIIGGLISVPIFEKRKDMPPPPPPQDFAGGPGL